MPIQLSIFLAIIGTLATAAGAATSVLSYLNNRHLRNQDDRIKEIHVLVDGKMTEALNRIIDLEKTLNGINDATEPSKDGTIALNATIASVHEQSEGKRNG